MGPNLVKGGLFGRVKSRIKPGKAETLLRSE